MLIKFPTRVKKKNPWFLTKITYAKGPQEYSDLTLEGKQPAAPDERIKAGIRHSCNLDVDGYSLFFAKARPEGDFR